MSDKKIVLIALYDLYSNGIRGLHSYCAGVLGYDTASLYLMESTYTDGLVGASQLNDMLVQLKMYDPEYIGIGVRSPLFLLFAHICQAIRSILPDAKIIAGGPHAEGDPEGCAAFADFVVTGDGEPALRDILSGVTVGPFYRARVDNLDSLPFPYYGDDTHSYLAQIPAPVTKHTLYSQRGCPFGCSYCQESISRKRPIRMSVARLRQEVDYFLEVFPNIQVFTFSDSIFLRDQEWMNEFAAAFEGSGLEFWCWGFAPKITDDMLDAAKSGGVTHIRMGVQSGSEYIRKEILGRHDTLEQIMSAAALIEKHGLKSHFDFIVENPYDTPETMKETRDFIRSLPSFAVNKFELRYWPGTAITKRALDDGYISPGDVEGNFCRFGQWSYCYSQEFAQ